MAFEGCECKIYDCSTRDNLVAGHYYCHNLWKSAKKGESEYTKSQVREEHRRIVKCMKKNGMEHDSPLE